MVKHPLRRLLAPSILFAFACGPAEGVEVQELPSLESSTPEARAGLPEIRGVWRFAGWELAEGDSTGLEAPLPAFGMIWLQTQKRDSLAGSYVVPGGRTPLIGEVRRDSVVALVALLGPGEGRFIAGRVSRDTLWLDLTSLTEPGSWRSGSRAAFVRAQVAAAPFTRLRGAMPPPVVPDSAALAGAGVDTLAPVAGATTAPPPSTSGAEVAPPATAGARPPAPPAAAPSTGAAPTTPPAAQPQQPAPRPAREAPPVREPAPTPEPPDEEPEPEPSVPPLLGEPVDTPGDE